MPEEEKKTQLQTTNQSPLVSATEFLKASGDMDVEKISKILELQERWELNQARKAYTADFATSQANIASVIKTKVNPQTHSRYADLENVLDMSKPAYTEQGFSVIFYEGETSKVDYMRICADVLHKAGHKETYHLDIPLDGVGIKGNANMTKIHGMASSVSYARRYLMCMIWNIPTGDNDGNAKPDGKTVKPKTELNEKQQAFLDGVCNGLIPSKGTKVNKVNVKATILAHKGEFPTDTNDVPKAIGWLQGAVEKHSIIFINEGNPEY